MTFDTPLIDDATRRVNTLADRAKARAIALEHEHPRLALAGYLFAGLLAGRLARRGDA